MEKTTIYFKIPTYRGLNFVQMARDIRPKACTLHLWILDDVEEMIWLGFQFASIEDYTKYITLVHYSDLAYKASDGTTFAPIFFLVEYKYADKKFMSQLWVKADKDYLKNGKL